MPISIKPAAEVDGNGISFEGIGIIVDPKMMLDESNGVS